MLKTKTKRYFPNGGSMAKVVAVLLGGLLAQGAWAQQQYNEKEPLHLLSGLEYKLEAQASLSDGKTPLWLNANKHGLSSLESTNGYLRGSLERPLAEDSLRHWGVGYGLDVAVAHHYTSRLVVQQAYGELRWLHGVLTVGAKEFPMELKNNQLSSGSQTLGINARPVPQVRLSLPEYWVLPFANGWLRLKGHVAYGKTTDQNWQHDFTQQKQKYTDGALFHSKAGYLMIGYPERFFPLSLELGLEMAAQFGGTAYVPWGSDMRIYKGNNGLSGMWHAFMPGGADVPEEGTEYQNAEGNQLGSWMMRVNYDDDSWKLGLYIDKYFEDHSSMLQLDYNGYGTGDEWTVRKKRRYFIYDLKDMLLGLELNIKYGTWLRNVVFEYTRAAPSTTTTRPRCPTTSAAATATTTTTSTPVGSIGDRPWATRSTARPSTTRTASSTLRTPDSWPSTWASAAIRQTGCPIGCWPPIRKDWAPTTIPTRRSTTTSAPCWRPLIGCLVAGW